MVKINLTDFGLLVKHLRKNNVDERGNRWTRESLSEAIHLTANQLGRLERGDRKYLDTQTLQLLARALKLTNLEQKEFFIAAVGLKDEILFDHEDPLAQLNNLVNLMEKMQIPAFAVDPYGDILASNTSCLKLFLITPEMIEYARTIPAGLNHMHFIYSSVFGFRNIIGPVWRKVAAIEILLFRRSTLRYRHTEYFDYIFKALLREKEFDIDWYSSHRNPDYYDLTYEAFDYDHPRYGPLSYVATETIINTQKGDIYLILYNPANQSTCEVFKELKGPNKNHTLKLAGWPEKVML